MRAAPALALLDQQPEPWHAAALAWTAQLAQRTGSRHTPNDYMRHLARFTATFGDPASVTAMHVHAFAYGAGPSGRVPSSSTVNVRLAAISSYFDFCRRMNFITRNPADDVKRTRSAPPLPRGLSADQVRKLLAAIPPTPAGLRDRAIVVTALLAGLRRSELMQLQRSNLDFNDVWHMTLRVKGGRKRRRELPAPALDAIVDALQAEGRTPATMAPHARVFSVSGNGFYRNLRLYAARAGVGNVSPHVLRHTAAKLQRESGATIEEVASLLGHRSIATTAVYLARLEAEHDARWLDIAAKVGILASNE